MKIEERIEKYLTEAPDRYSDLSKDFDEKAVIKPHSGDKSSGTLYRKGKVVQMHWKTDMLGRSMRKPETWTSPTEEQAKDNFEDMRDRWGGIKVYSAFNRKGDKVTVTIPED
jgi:hypothetical protein